VRFFLKCAETKGAAVSVDIGEDVMILIAFQPPFFPVKGNSDSRRIMLGRFM
jgi:hypothetical protein